VFSVFLRLFVDSFYGNCHLLLPSCVGGVSESDGSISAASVHADCVDDLPRVDDDD